MCITMLLQKYQDQDRWNMSNINRGERPCIWKGWHDHCGYLSGSSLSVLFGWKWGWEPPWDFLRLFECLYPRKAKSRGRNSPCLIAVPRTALANKGKNLRFLPEQQCISFARIMRSRRWDACPSHKKLFWDVLVSGWVRLTCNSRWNTLLLDSSVSEHENALSFTWDCHWSIMFFGFFVLFIIFHHCVEILIWHV